MLRILTGGPSDTQPPCCALHGLLERRSGETGERRERRLRGVQPEPKVRVVIGRIEIGGLVPVRVPPCPDLRAAVAARGMRGVACPHPLTPSPFGRGGTRLKVILQTRDVAAAVAAELHLNPVNGGAVAVGALAPIAEGRESLDGRLVALQVEARDQLGYGGRGLGPSRPEPRWQPESRGRRGEQTIAAVGRSRATAAVVDHESFPHD